MTKPQKRIVIVGGGTAGWMAAAGLQQHFQNLVDIVLVASSEIGTIGVGEATIPTIRNFYHELGMHDLDVMRATQATCKLGIEFNDWHHQGSSFIHPFGVYGQAVRGIDFHHFWLKLRQRGAAGELGDYSLGAMLARHKKFTLPAKNPPSTLSVFDWALHFDASLFARHMQKFAQTKGVTHIDAAITKVNQHLSNGFIRSVTLASGEEIAGDLFIDCSGFRGLMIEETLHVGYEDWSQWLLCDSAFAVQSHASEAPASYTKVTAHSAGWQWKIPLQHRTGNGHVFSSGFMSDDEAQQLLIQNITGELIHSPRKLSFTPGRRKQAWSKNCIALGLAAGFLEPLESTSIALVQTGIEKIKTLLTNFDFNQAVVDEFNETTALEYERVRDFLILHYKASAREDSEFWRYCKAMAIPATLEHKMALFKASGYVVNYRWEMFHLPSWLAIFAGFNFLPDTYDLRVDTFDEALLKTSLDKMNQSLREAVSDSPDHAEFIARHCAAEIPS